MMYLFEDLGLQSHLQAIAVFIAAFIFLHIFFKGRLFKIVFYYILFFCVCSLLYYVFPKPLWLEFEPVEIRAESLIYAYVLLLILAVPLSYIDLNIDYKLDRYAPFFKFLTIILLSFSVFPFFEGIYRAINIDAASLLNAYEGHYDSYSVITSISIQLRNYFRYFNYLLLFYYILNLRKNKENRILLYANLLVLATTIILAFSGGARGIIVNELNYLVVCYFLFESKYSNGLRKKIKRIATYSLVIIIILLGIVTMARSSDDGDNIALISWVLLYPGQGPNEFSRNMMPSTVRTNGDNSFSLFKTIVGKKTFKDNDQRREYWERYQYIPNYIFYTLIGDIYSDLGYFGTMSFCILFSVIISLYIRNVYKDADVSLTAIMTSIFIFEWISMGMMTNCYKSYYYQFFILFTLIVSYGYTVLTRKGKI